MTFEQMMRDVEATGWFLWHLGRRTDGVWNARLCDPRFNGSARRVPVKIRCSGAPAGGPSAVAALQEAVEKLLPPKKEAIDLDFLLG